jgi:signal transduction histidine kinase
VQQHAQNGAPALRLGVVGGGRRCLSILRLLESRRLKLLRAEVVGVADLNPRAVGFTAARERGIFTTTDYLELLQLPELDLIIELTGQDRVLRELARKKPESVGVIDYTASLLFHDIASFGVELERKEDEISVERSFAQALTRAASEGVMVLDTDYRIRRINRAACRWADLPPDQARDRFCFQVLHRALTPCHSPDTPCPMQETLATGRSAHCLQEFRDAEGEPHFCDVSTYPLVNREGKVVQVLEIFRDLTRELDSRLELRAQAIKEDLARLVQEDKLMSLGKLVASVAHEINNPLASILNFTKLLKRRLAEGGPGPGERDQWRGWLELSVAEAERSRDIVANLLSFARQQSVEAKRVDLVELIRQIAAVTGHRMEMGGVELELDLPDEPLEVWGEATQLQQCLANLVFNALEAMPRGGRLSIACGRRGSEVWAEVSDTGGGIPPEVLPLIFEPFFSTKSEVQGVGLGLSMVYGIISGHRGRIEVDSRPGQGARFSLSLPHADSAPERGAA